ncbi:hypothetical protein SAMN05216338_107525 [Bradyrhizobium sp. Rc2d]|nr:hypothetical protein SAMN05216338_107525 [Bradyrhizobium sp. Rc2d]
MSRGIESSSASHENELAVKLFQFGVEPILNCAGLHRLYEQLQPNLSRTRRNESHEQSVR